MTKQEIMARIAEEMTRAERAEQKRALCVTRGWTQAAIHYAREADHAQQTLKVLRWLTK